MRTQKHLLILLSMTLVFTAIPFLSVNAASSSTPGKVKGITATADGTKVTVTWNKVSGADGYQIYRDGSKVKSQKGLKYTKEMKAQTKYSYKVRAYNKVKQYYNSKTRKWVNKKPSTKQWKGKKTRIKTYTGDFSKTVTVTTEDGDDSSDLPAPADLSVSDDADDDVELEWDEVENAVMYIVHRNGVKVAETDVPWYCEEDELSDGKYIYEVSAVDADGNEGRKAKVEVVIGSGGSSTDPGTPETPTDISGGYKTHPEITLAYGNTTIYLGQAWTEDVHSKLKAGSSGEDIIVRKNFDNLYVGKTSKTGLDQTIYMIDTGDYDNFLAVYVSNGQIVRWIRNSGTFGKDGSDTLKIGDVINVKETTYKCGGVKSGHIISYWDNYVVNSWGDSARREGMVRYDLPDGCILMGGFSLNSSEDGFYFGGNKLPAKNPDKDIEKQVMLHIMNAIRGVKGVSPLRYSDYLDGTGKSFTGTIEGMSYTDQIFGAQAWADSMYASNALSHGNTDWGYGPVDKGPLGGPQGTRQKAEECLTALLMFKLNLGYGWLTENVGRAETTTGEKFVCQYYDSPGHYKQIISSEHTHVGMGVAGRYHCEEFGGPSGL